MDLGLPDFRDGDECHVSCCAALFVNENSELTCQFRIGHCTEMEGFYDHLQERLHIQAPNRSGRGVR